MSTRTSGLAPGPAPTPPPAPDAASRGRSRTSGPDRASRTRRRASDWATLGVIVLAALLVAAPLVLVALNALKSPQDYATNGPLALPRELYTDGLRAFWERVDFPRKLWNSVWISGTVAIAAVVLSVLNAYAIGIGRVRGRQWVVVAFLTANLLPQEALLYPLYQVFKAVGLYDNPWSVVITFVVIQSAFGTYLLASVLGSFPREILEAAAIDGAGRWTMLWRVVVPICRPTIAVLMIFFFIWTWNEFLIPLTFLVSNDNQTIPVAISVLQGDRLMDVTTTSASALLGVLPTLLFFLLFQRTLTRGVTAGAVK